MSECSPDESVDSGGMVRNGQTVPVDLTAAVELDASPERVRPWIASLDRYPSWLSIVAKAEPLAPVGPEGEDLGVVERSDDRPTEAWAVELRAKVGPLSRSKRLRMVRSIDELLHLRFERAELDGRSHAVWTLDAELRPRGSGTELVMVLHYGGGFGGGLVERLLADEIEASRSRLRALLDHETGGS